MHLLAVVWHTGRMIIKTDRYRHRYTVGEMYRVLLAVLPSIGILKRNRKDEIVDAQFIERLMLAVTEVNGCAVCSYAHAKMALQSRFKAKVRYTNSSLFYEIGMSLAPLLLIPVALLHHLLRRIVSLFH